MLLAVVLFSSDSVFLDHREELICGLTQVENIDLMRTVWIT